MPLLKLALKSEKGFVKTGVNYDKLIYETQKYYELVEKQLNKKLGNIYNIYKLFSLIMLVLPFETGTMFVLPFETRTLFSFHVDYRMSLEKARRSLLKLMKLERASQYIVN